MSWLRGFVDGQGRPNLVFCTFFRYTWPRRLCKTPATKWNRAFVSAFWNCVETFGPLERLLAQPSGLIRDARPKYERTRVSLATNTYIASFCELRNRFFFFKTTLRGVTEMGVVVGGSSQGLLLIDRSFKSFYDKMLRRHLKETMDASRRSNWLPDK